MKKSLLLLVLIATTITCFATVDKQLWFGFVHQGRVHKHWGYWAEFQHRTKNEFANNLHTEIFRVGATYFVNTDLRITAGYAAVLHFPSLTNQAFVRPEHRPWQQVAYNYTKGRIRLSQYLRAEERFLRKTAGETLAEGHIFRQRFRYNAMLIILFNKKEFKQGSFGLVLNDEVFINAYSTDKVKAFDQNRAFAGLSYSLTNATQLQLGYLNVFSFTPKGNETVHSLRFVVFHYIDWRKKK
ncbi:MAG TPA: DUF2490 domain-containing protein [Chitinophagales bacterium]|nr:DUF2490 domain-containing protein [Chitinophagales bacterium]